MKKKAGKRNKRVVSSSSDDSIEVIKENIKEQGKLTYAVSELWYAMKCYLYITITCSDPSIVSDNAVAMQIFLTL